MKSISRHSLALPALLLVASFAPAQRGGSAQKDQDPAVTPKQLDAQNAVGAASVQKPPGAKTMETVQPAAVQTRAPNGKSMNDPNARTNDPRAKARSIARQMVNLERLHRERNARMDRLVELFRQSGANDKATEVESLRKKEDMRYRAAMDGYSTAIGPDLFGRITAAMNKSGGVNTVRPPNPAPVQPPEPPPAGGATRKGKGRS